MFPATSLPYGLLSRLAELSTPVEKYHLQVAGGNFNICPPTIQPVKKELNCNLAVIDGELTLRKYVEVERDYVPVVLDDNALIAYTFSVHLRTLDFEHLSSDVFQHLLIKAPRMELDDCDMSEEFLQALSKLCLVPIKEIEIHDPYQDYICLKSLLQAFPQVDELNFYGVQLPDHWLTEIMEAQQAKLSFIYVRADPENIGKFDADELLAFLQDQNEMFTLTFQIDSLSDTDEYAKTLEKLLKKHLKAKDPQLLNFRPQVRICGYDIWESFFLPKRRMKRNVDGSKAASGKKEKKKKRTE